MLTIDGLVTGIDTESIIAGLLQIQQRQIDQLQSRRQEAITRQAAVQTLETRLAALQSHANRLASSVNNPLAKRSASVSDESALIVTASNTAEIGSYDIRVNSLAQAHQVATQAFSDADAAITEGTFTLRVGNRPPLELTIDSSNNTLQGLADAINGGNSGVSATIVQDGSGSGSSFRLLLTSASTGVENAISLTNHLAASGSGAIQPQFDFDNPVQEATNASISLGNGPGALTVQSATNEFGDVISGATISVLNADPGKTIRVNIQRDVSTAQSAIEDFVAGFNDVMSFIDAQTSYDAETGEAGLLLGNRAIADIQHRLRSTLFQPVPGANPQLNTFTSLGIRVTDRGRLEIDQTRLSDVLSGRVDGISGQDVERLFSLTGTSSHAGLRFLLGSSRTRASTEPYAVDITRAPERAALTAGGALAATTSIDGSNNRLSLTIDGATLDITLKEGTYSPLDLAAELESLINSHPDMLGRRLRVGLTGANELTLMSESYGSSSQITIQSGTALADLGLTAGQSASGADVQGHFIVNGKIEAATGRGRILTGNSDNESTADLQVQVSLTAGQVQDGPEGELRVTRGVASSLSGQLTSLLDSVSGKIRTVTRQYQETAESIQSSIDRQQAAFDLQQESLLKQFAALESAMAEIQSTSSFLGNQLAGLASLKKS